MNAITTQSSTAVAVIDNDPFAAALASEGGFTGKFLQFDGNTGDFLFGPEEDKKELAHGTRLAVNMPNLRKGFICWKQSEVIDEVMQTITENPQGPNKANLEDHGPYPGKRDGWKEQRSFDMIEAESGDLFNFKTASGGGRRGVRNMLESFVKTYKQHPGMMPIIELGATAFETKDEDGNKAGKKFAPVFKIVGWLPAATYEEMASASQEESTDSGEDDGANYEPETATTEVASTAVVEPTQTAPAVEGGRRAKRF